MATNEPTSSTPTESSKAPSNPPRTIIGVTDVDGGSSSAKPHTGFADRSVKQELDAGAVIEKAPDYRGVITKIHPDNARRVTPDIAGAQARSWEDASSGREYTTDQRRTIDQVKLNVPDFNRAKDTSIAHTLAEDMRHVEQAAEANKKGAYVRLVAKEGSFQQGIIEPTSDGSGPKRQGIWQSIDKEGVTRQISEFKDNKLEGETRIYNENGRITGRGFHQAGRAEGIHYDYNEAGEVTRRNHFKNDESLKVEVVDPEEQRKRRANAAFTSGLSFGR